MIDLGERQADYEFARTIGVVALALILFEGGLTAGFDAIRPVLRPSLGLALVGTFITAAITGLAAAWLFDLSTLEGLLLGSIIASTDGAAVFSILRGSTLRRRLAHTLEGEAGFNDPVAVLLVIGFVEWITQPDYGVADMALLFVVEVGIGLAVGLAVGWLSVQGLRRARLDTPGLYPVATLAAAAVAFGAADALHGSGFLAVYLAGLALGSARIPAKRTVVVFHQGLGWVAQIVMFLALGLLVFPSRLDDVWFEGTVLALVLLFVARPIATIVGTALDSFTARERVVLGWAGLRGAVPVVLATFPVIDGVPGSEDVFFNIIFFAVVLSTLLQGTTFEPLAARLGVTTNEPALPRPLAETGTIRRLGAEIMEYPVGPEDAVAGRRVRDLGLPRDALVSVIVRGSEAVLPRGSTRVEAGDRLHVVVRSEVAASMGDLLERWQHGPLGDDAPAPRELVGISGVFTSRPWDEEKDGDPAYPGRAAGRGGARAPPDPARQPGCAGHAHRRPLRRHGTDARRRRRAPAAGLRAASPLARDRRHGAGLVAGGYWRACTLESIACVHPHGRLQSRPREGRSAKPLAERAAPMADEPAGDRGQATRSRGLLSSATSRI